MTADEWYISEHYRDTGTIYYRHDGLGTILYLEQANGDGWNVGFFDTTLRPHPIVPAVTESFADKEQAVGYALSLAMDAGEILSAFRATDRYQSAAAVDRRAPTDVPGYEVSQAQMRVFEGRESESEAIAALCAGAGR